MDLGHQGQKALVCAASKGWGAAVPRRWPRGVDLVINARGADALNATAADIAAKYGVKVFSVAADITLGHRACRRA